PRPTLIWHFLPVHHPRPARLLPPAMSFASHSMSPMLMVPGGPFPNSAYHAYRVGAQPAGVTAVFVSDGGLYGPGTANATFDEPSIEGLNWGIYVPEPATLALLSVAAIVFRRR